MSVPGKPGNSQKEFIKLFERLAYTQSYSTVFTDFLDYALLMMRWDKTEKDFEELERRWTKKEDHAAFAQLLELYLIMAEDGGSGCTDPLGDLFMELISHGRNGQFFTPMEICVMLAHQIVGKDAEDGKTVYDPACGSGRTLLAAARINRNLKFYGADIDITCCKMTVLNMIVNQMEGEVAWMDSLRWDHWKSWHLKKIMAPPPYSVMAVQYIVTGPFETNMLERKKETQAPALVLPTKSKPEQLKLF
jgi:methylase of polypeptide subunit release factors